MPRKRLSLRKIEEVLRLRFGAKMGVRQVAAVGIGKATVSEYVARAQAQGLSWPLPEGMDAAEFERRLLPSTDVERRASQRAQPDWQAIDRELRRKGVTLLLLWQEYIECHPQGYSYTRFCELHAAYKGRVDVVMRQTHRAGEKLFVD